MDRKQRLILLIRVKNLNSEAYRYVYIQRDLTYGKRKETRSALASQIVRLHSRQVETVFR